MYLNQKVVERRSSSLYGVKDLKQVQNPTVICETAGHLANSGEAVANVLVFQGSHGGLWWIIAKTTSAS
jgi:hypothetical protein